MSDKVIVRGIQQTIARIKAMEPGMYLTYTFPDMPDGIFFMHRRDLMPLAERYEAYEKALLEIHAIDECERIKAVATEVLGEVLCDDAEQLGVEEYDDSLELTDDDTLGHPDDFLQDFTDDDYGQGSKPS
jgi:hypothetical protein